MGAPKPILGYPTVTDAVIALKGQGLSNEDVGTKIGKNASLVSSLLASARRTHKRVGQVAAPPARDLALPPDVLHILRFAAIKRGTDAHGLARDIICRVVDDNLIDAVLDDAGGE